MVMAFPIVLQDGKPAMVSGTKVLEQQVSAVLGTREGTYYPDRRYGIDLPLFTPNNLEAARVSFEVSEELSERIAGATVEQVSFTQGALNQLSYEVVVSKANEVVKARAAVLI